MKHTLVVTPAGGASTVVHLDAAPKLRDFEAAGELAFKHFGGVKAVAVRHYELAAGGVVRIFVPGDFTLWAKLKRRLGVS